MDQKELVIVNAFDADGCLFNLAYKQFFTEDKFRPDSQAVIKANSKLLDEIVAFCLDKASVGYLLKVYNCVFSNRQSGSTDTFNNNLNNTESCFRAIEKVHHYLTDKLRLPNIEVILGTYLLSDSFHDIPIGDTFYGKNIRENKFIFDDSKLTIIYGQTMWILNENPNATIIYRCFDDDYFCKFVRTFDFLARYQNWIHRNILAQLFKYYGDEIKLEREVQGFGEEIDHNYGNTLKLMCYVANGVLSKADVCDSFDRNNTSIQRFEKFRKLGIKVSVQIEKADKFLKDVCLRTKEFLTENATSINKDYNFLKIKTSYTGDGIFHLVGLLDTVHDSVAFIKYFLRMGIDPNVERNKFGELPSDLLSDAMPTKSWLLLPTSQNLPRDTKPAYWSHIEYKEYIQVKLDYCLAKPNSNHRLLSDIKDLLSSEGDDFSQKLTDLKSKELNDSDWIVLINLIDEWMSSECCLDLTTTESVDSDDFSGIEESDNQEKTISNLKRSLEDNGEEKGPLLKKPCLKSQYSEIWSPDPSNTTAHDSLSVSPCEKSEGLEFK